MILLKLKIRIVKHKQLTFEQRYAIEHMLKEKNSKKSIITSIGLVESTFYLKLKSKKQVYNLHHENMLAEVRRKPSHYKTVFLLKCRKQLKINWKIFNGHQNKLKASVKP